ncbi:uncharacterized protein LOC62_05G006829 [Vanrija pseudolonga]|uniref:HD domain-containing protein n=1 Tax=Vanrija pseudolonga TaxID=143232 RepID=A0AAF0YAV6_9TREE|nr:hypothetical protein LOC62_05G006829 [Vanrija pseudolonga]
MPTDSPFPQLPVSGITIPTTALTTAALSYSREHTSASTVNHCLRSAAFALIFASKIPPYAAADAEAIVLSCILHDLGWAIGDSKALLSSDKRFEVDGADLAREFTRTHSDYDEVRLQEVWDAIALHTTPSIALHKQPVVAATAMGILADFTGPHHPSGLLTVAEYKEVVGAFPRLDFREELPRVMCGLCRDKPATTYDNFVGEFGAELLEGTEGESYRADRDKHNVRKMLLGGLEATKQYE